MKRLTDINYPLAVFYRQQVTNAGLTPVDAKTAKEKLQKLSSEISEEKLKNRIIAVCKYYRDISDTFYRYRSKVVPIEILTDVEVLRFLKEKAQKTIQIYPIKYNPELFSWAINIAKSKKIEDVVNKVKEGASYEEVKGALLKAYEALEIEGDYFLRQVLDFRQSSNITV